MKPCGQCTVGRRGVRETWRPGACMLDGTHAWVPCGRCKGSGRVRECSRCLGVGAPASITQDGFTVNCPWCVGTGEEAA